MAVRFLTEQENETRIAKKAAIQGVSVEEVRRQETEEERVVDEAHRDASSSWMKNASWDRSVVYSTNDEDV